jgi:tRNA1(Val) A37 N6-methylase TrmN6
MTAEFTEDALLGGRVRLRQPVSGYRAAIDPVLLAAAVTPPSGANVLDAGCGTGAASFCLAARCPTVRIAGLERDATSAAYARDGIALNNLADRVTVTDGDLAALPASFRNAFDIVMTNPPYGSSGTVAPDVSRAAAHHESDVDLAAWIKACLACLKPKGRLVMIHRADRLSDIIAALGAGAGDLHILPIQSRVGEPARRVIVNAGKGRRTPDSLLPPFIMHDASGAFTPEAQAVLRDGAALSSTGAP